MARTREPLPDVDGSEGAPGLLVPRFESTWAYLRHELLYICWAVMEVALIAPIALAIMPWAHYWPSTAFTIWLLLVLFIPFQLSRLMTLANVPLRKQQNIMLMALLLTIVLALRTLLYDGHSILGFGWLRELYGHFVEADNPFWARDLAIFFLIVVMWWRGISLTNRRVDIQDVGLRLRVGGLILAPIAIGFGMLPRATSPTFYVLLFFLAGLMAIALTRAEEIALGNMGQSYPMQPRWVAIIFLTSASIVLLAGLMASALAGETLPQAISWLAPLWNALYFLGMVVVTTVTFLTLFLLKPMQWLAQGLAWLMAQLGIEVMQPPEQVPQEFGETEIEQLFQLLREREFATFLLINRILTIIVIVGILLLLYGALSRYFKQRSEPSGVEESPYASSREEREKMGFGQRLRDRFGLWQRWRAAATVRRLYQQMCSAAAAQGYPRAASQTPYEYLKTLDEVWPRGETETRSITEAYIRVRYGEVPEKDEALEKLRAAWRRLEQMGPRETSVK